VPTRVDQTIFKPPPLSCITFGWTLRLLGDSTGPQICQEDDEEAEQEKGAWTWGNMKKLERLSKSSIPEARLRLRNMTLFEPETLPT
jgi:hypothetical protein